MKHPEELTLTQIAMTIPTEANGTTRSGEATASPPVTTQCQVQHHSSGITSDIPISLAY